MHDPKKQEELEQHEVKEVVRFLKRHGKLIGLVAAAVVIALGALHWRDHRKATRLAEAEALLRAAETPEQLIEVVERYRSTAIAPIALLDLAKTTFNRGHYAEARDYYNRFIRTHPRHELRAVADLGLAHCNEAEGNTKKAVEEFRQLTKRLDQTHHLYPLAVLGLARTLTDVGQTDEARDVLIAFLDEFRQSVWSGPAQNALRLLP